MILLTINLVRAVLLVVSLIVCFAFVVIEWIKQKIHEPETEQQITTTATTDSSLVTMDDFRVCRD